MIQEIYTDGIGNIHVTGNVVRFDLITLQPQLQKEDGQPIYNMNHRVVMPLEAFVQAFMLQDNVMKQLIKAGIVKNEAAAASQTVEAE